MHLDSSTDNMPTEYTPFLLACGHIHPRGFSIPALDRRWRWNRTTVQQDRGPQSLAGHRRLKLDRLTVRAVGARPRRQPITLTGLGGGYERARTLFNEQLEQKNKAAWREHVPSEPHPSVRADQYQLPVARRSHISLGSVLR